MRLRATRMEALSDGVFAIAITLLVLEIGVPEGSGGNLLRAIADQWPSYLAYLVSFATIGALWLTHVVVTEFTDRATPMLFRLNLLLLLTVSFLPYPTGLLADYIRDESPVRVAVTFYGTCLFACAIVMSVVWRYVVRSGLVRADASQDQIRVLSQRLTPSLGGYLITLALGFFLPLAAVVCYLVLAVLIMGPVTGLARRS